MILNVPVALVVVGILFTCILFGGFPSDEKYPKSGVTLLGFCLKQTDL